MKENRFVIMRNRLKSREMVIQEEKEREKTLETMYEVDLLIDSALRRAEDGKFSEFLVSAWFMPSSGLVLVRFEPGTGLGLSKRKRLSDGTGTGCILNGSNKSFQGLCFKQ